MDLRAKLARLAAKRAGSTSAAAAAEAPVENGEGDAAPAPSGGPPHVVALRARLAEMLTRTRVRDERRRQERREQVEARIVETLPFDAIEGAGGLVHVRTMRHATTARVGRVDIEGARVVSAPALSLLALDPGLAALDPARALYLDTESTGLAGGTGTVPFLVGLAWFEDDGLVVEQLLLRQLGEEAPLLARVAERIEAASMLVSFNGKAFDLPLLRTRFVMNRLPAPPARPHLDLVHVARRIHRSARGGVREPVHDRGGPFVEVDDEAGSRRAMSCKLTALERHVLGFDRIDDVPSADIPARYGQFLRSGDGDAIRAVCDHNAWDVVSMAALVSIYGSAVTSLDDATSAGPLGGRDLVGVAATLQRAGDLVRARTAASTALQASMLSSGRDDELTLLALRVRGAIAKRARDVDGAVVDFEALAEVHDDASARLELAKLYEHRLKDPTRALHHVRSGTTETGAEAAHRASRLERKTMRATQRELPLTTKSATKGTAKAAKG